MAAFPSASTQSRYRLRSSKDVLFSAPNSRSANSLAPSTSLALGAEHGGFELKEQLKSHLRERGYAVRDLGTNSTEPVDYPKIAQQVAQLVASGAVRFGIMIDGAGIGSAMTANKIPGVLAAAAYNEAPCSQQPGTQRRERAHARRRSGGRGDGEAHRRCLPHHRLHRRPPPQTRQNDPRPRERKPRRESRIDQRPLAGGHRADRRPPLLVERANV